MLRGANTESLLIRRMVKKTKKRILSRHHRTVFNASPVHTQPSPSSKEAICYLVSQVLKFDWLNTKELFISNDG